MAGPERIYLTTSTAHNVYMAVDAENISLKHANFPVNEKKNVDGQASQQFQGNSFQEETLAYFQDLFPTVEFLPTRPSLLSLIDNLNKNGESRLVEATHQSNYSVDGNHNDGLAGVQTLRDIDWQITIFKDIALHDLKEKHDRNIDIVLVKDTGQSRTISLPRFDPNGSFQKLSPREKQVLFLAQRFENKEIGKMLHIAIMTVKYHLNEVFNKLGTNDRTESVVKAIDKGLLPVVLSESSLRSVPHLTNRMHEVLAFVSQGFENTEIASALAISKNTVRAHLGSASEALKATNRTHAAVYFIIAQKLGLIT